ncbi:hypothetical protein AVEN_24260-1 [Araneus ventricosus]|uniref:Uncharacterized protein n=1 Tax=Araneus ventricosus TaxID=182803 RepID=A0A4Y2LQG1_ARAVE|nr:hypothetical protein AVEN_24260-1 [Araneus ventricosus]
MTNSEVLKLLRIRFDHIPNSNFSLQQSCSTLALHVCKLAASSVRQDRKFITSLNKFSKEPPLVELAANLSRQVRCKRVEKRVRIRILDSNPGNLGYQPVA